MTTKCHICGEKCSGTIRIYDKIYSLDGLGEMIICSKCHKDWISMDYAALDEKRIDKLRRDLDERA